VKFKWAVLNVLAKSPDRRVTFAEIKREVGRILETGNRAEQERFSELGDIDLLQAGLVLIDDVGIQITDAGLSLLRSLKCAEVSAPAAPSSAEYQFKPLDSHILTEDRLKIFDFEMRRLAEQAGSMQDTSYSTTAADQIVEHPLEIDGRIIAGDEHAGALAPEEIEQADAIELIVPPAQDAPAFLQRKSAAKAQDTRRRPSDRYALLFANIADRARSLAGAWRGHVVRETSNPKSERISGSVWGAVVAFLSLVAVLACASAAIGLIQIKSLKSESAMLQRELGLLKERFGNLERAEKTKLEAVQNAAAEKAKAAAEPRPDQTNLSLSREEIQLIRDFIKPAPTVGAPATAINVGDTVGIATVPLPSQLMEKIPKLIGARFTTRNGSIIIVRPDSRKADAVLPPS
jgi:hypothetical protein